MRERKEREEGAEKKVGYVIDIIIVILEGLEKRKKRRNIGGLKFCVVLLMGSSCGLVDAKVFWFSFLFNF